MVGAEGKKFENTEHAKKTAEQLEKDAVLDKSKQQEDVLKEGVVEDKLAGAAKKAANVSVVAKTVTLTADPEKVKKAMEEAEERRKSIRNSINGTAQNGLNADVLRQHKGQLEDELNKLKKLDGITLTAYIDTDPTTKIDEKRYSLELDDNLKKKTKEKLKALINGEEGILNLQKEIDARIEANHLLVVAQEALNDYENDGTNEAKRKAAHDARMKLSIKADEISKFVGVSAKSVNDCKSLITAFQTCLDTHGGYSDIQVTNKKGKKENVGTKGETIDAKSYNGKSFDKGVLVLNQSPAGIELGPQGIQAVQSCLCGQVGLMANQSNIQTITQTRGEAGTRYAKKYMKLYYNHQNGLSKKSEAEYQGSLANIIGKAGDKSFGTIREIKIYGKQLGRLAKKEGKKLKHAKKALACAVERACARHQLRRSMAVTDYLMQMEARGPEGYGLPDYSMEGMRKSDEGIGCINYAQAAFGNNRRAEIEAICGSKAFAKMNLPPYLSAGVLTPTEGIESHLSKAARKNPETRAEFKNGRMEVMPGGSAVALTWYLGEYESKDKDGNTPEIVNPQLATFMLERWFKTGDQGYDIIGGLRAMGKSKKEAQTIAHAIMKDAFRANGEWRTRMGYLYTQYSDNYRANKGNLEPSRDYSGKGPDDIPENDKHRLRGMAAANATAGSFCTTDGEKAMARKRLSEVRENNTAARNPIEGFSDGLGNPIVGEQMLGMIEDIDGKGAGGARDRYLGGLSSDGYFIGGLNTVELTFNNLAKDVFRLDAPTAHKLGKVAKFATAAGLVYGGWRMLKWVWSGREGKNDKTGFWNRAGRLGILAGGAFLLGDEVKSAIWGGQFGKSGVWKKLMSAFGMEGKYEAANGIAPVNTLGVIFGGMATSDVLEMFDPDGLGGFELNKDALKMIKKAHPNMNQAYLDSITGILKDPDSAISLYLNEGLTNLGVNKDTIGSVKANYGSMKFSDYINSYVAASHITKELLLGGFTKEEVNEYNDALVSANAAEKVIITSRINQMKQYGAYYPELRVRMNHVLKYRPDMIGASGLAGKEAALIAGLANMKDFKALTREYVTGVGVATPNGFDKTSTFSGFLDTINNKLYGNDPDMRKFLDQAKGFQELESELNTRAEGIFTDLRPKTTPVSATNNTSQADRYLNRTAGSGEVYQEKGVIIGGKKVFIGIEQGTTAIPGSTQMQSRLVLRVPKGSIRQKVTINQYDGKEMYVKGLGRDASPNLQMDVFGGFDPISKNPVTGYKKRSVFTANLLEDIVKAVGQSKPSVIANKKQHTDLGSLGAMADEVEFSFQLGGTRP